MSQVVVVVVGIPTCHEGSATGDVGSAGDFDSYSSNEDGDRGGGSDDRWRRLLPTTTTAAPVAASQAATRICRLAVTTATAADAMATMEPLAPWTRM